MRKRSGHYGVLAYHFGLGLAALVIAHSLVTPIEYPIGAIAIDGLLAFALGTVLAANFDTLLRMLSRAATLRQNLAGGARAAFYDLGISRTSGRNGLLIYVSLFERSCVLLTDIGIDGAALGASWVSAQEALDSAVKRRDLPDFYRALESLGPVLSKAHPHSEDDVTSFRTRYNDSAAKAHRARSRGPGIAIRRQRSSAAGRRPFVFGWLAFQRRRLERRRRRRRDRAFVSVGFVLHRVPGHWRAARGHHDRVLRSQGGHRRGAYGWSTTSPEAVQAVQSRRSRATAAFAHGSGPDSLARPRVQLGLVRGFCLHAVCGRATRARHGHANAWPRIWRLRSRSSWSTRGSQTCKVS